MCTQAADEIERLRAREAELHRKLDEAGHENSAAWVLLEEAERAKPNGRVRNKYDSRVP